MKGCALAASEKKENSKSNLNSKTKLKKRGRAESEARYRPRRYSSTPPTIGGTVPSGLTSFPKKKLNSKWKRKSRGGRGHKR
jgi:hypothetical protein